MDDVERAEAAAEHETAYGLSFPIRTCEDLHNAIQAYGRAPTEKRGELRRFIVRRKAELGCPDVALPESWRIARGRT